MSNPYYRITISDRVRLHPRGMNNNILENIKAEAEKEYNNKCYKDYGYIDGIYKIVEDPRGVIQAEDSTASGLYYVTMECRMLVPIPNELIYASITGINEKMIIAETGQLKIIIYEKSINKDNIKYMKNAYYPVDAEGKPSGPAISVGSPVIIKLLATKIVPTKTQIMGLGMLESVVKTEDYDKVHTNKEEPILTPDDIEVLRGRDVEKTEPESESSVISSVNSNISSNISSTISSTPARVKSSKSSKTKKE